MPHDLGRVRDDGDPVVEPPEVLAGPRFQGLANGVVDGGRPRVVAHVGLEQLQAQGLVVGGDETVVLVQPGQAHVPLAERCAHRRLGEHHLRDGLGATGGALAQVGGVEVLQVGLGVGGDLREFAPKPVALGLHVGVRGVRRFVRVDDLDAHLRKGGGQLLEDVQETAGALQQLGVGVGDQVLFVPAHV